MYISEDTIRKTIRILSEDGWSSELKAVALADVIKAVMLAASSAFNDALSAQEARICREFVDGRRILKSDSWYFAGDAEGFDEIPF